MKKLFFAILILVLAVPAMALAAGKFLAPKTYVGVNGERVRVDGNKVTIPAPPPGVKIVQVQIYDKASEAYMNELGAVLEFTLEDGQGFNFYSQYPCDPAGKYRYDLLGKGQKVKGLVGYVNAMKPKVGACWAKQSDAVLFKK